jgi:tetratricopeptide (TPR) repeat protein
MRRGGVPVLVGVGLVVLTLAAYGPVWRNDFINLDDNDGIVDNPNVSGGLTPRDVRWAWTTFRQGNWIPLTWLSFQLDASLSPPGPGGRHVPDPVLFHAQNLFWHTATVVLLFCTLRRMTGALWRSAFVAALFAVHPLHVESVAWATERKDVLSTFFLVLTLLAYARYAERPDRVRYLLVLVPFVLGLLAKPMLVSLPLCLLLLDYWPLRRWQAAPVAEPTRVDTGTKNSGRKGRVMTPNATVQEPDAGRSVRGLLLEKLPLLAVSSASAVVTVIAQRSSEAVRSLSAVPVPDRLANAVLSCGWYLEKTFWPSGLALFYPHPQGDWAWGPVLAWAAVLLAITMLVLALVRRGPYLAVGWLWFLITLVPVIGLVQVGAQARADRYAYVPHVGLFVALVWGTAELLDRSRLPRALPAAAAAGCLAVLAAATWVQVGYWHDTGTVWDRSLAVMPDNEMARKNLAGYLYNEANHRAERGWKEGDPDLLSEAQRDYARAVELQPTDTAYRYNYALLLLRRGEAEKAGGELCGVVRLGSNHENAWYNLGLARLRVGHSVAAEKAFRRAAEINPGAADTRAQLGTALWDQGRYDEARSLWEGVLHDQPDQAEALAGMGLVLLREGKHDEAADKLTRAVRVGASPARWSLLGVAWGRLGQWPKAAAAHARAAQLLEQAARLFSRPPAEELAVYHRRLAHALRHVGQADEAAREYARSLELDRLWLWTTREKAWRLATDPDAGRRDSAEARDLAEQVCQSLRDPPAAALDTLAAAQAACGQFAEAADVARKALARALPEESRAVAARLRLYEQHKPYLAGKDRPQ